MNDMEMLAIAAAARKRKAAQASRNPDGTYGDIPEGMVLDPQTGSYTNAEMMANNMPMSRGKAAMIGAANGVTARWGDEAVGAVGGDLARERVRGATMAAQEQYPGTAIASEIAGAVAMPLPAAKMRAGQTAANMGRSAVPAAGYGALYGAGAADGSPLERGVGALSSGLLGGAIGAAAPLVSSGIGGVVNALRRNRAVRQAGRAAPSADQLKTQAGAIFDQAQSATLPRAGLAPHAQGALDDARRFGMDDMLTPQSERVASRMEDAATNPDPTMPFRELQTLREQASIPAGAVKTPTTPQGGKEAKIGTRFIDAIDSYLDDVAPQVSEDVRKARDMWSRLSKSKTIEDMLDRAGRQASGFENGIRIEIRKLLNNPRAVRGFSQAEREALDAIVTGTPFGNTMRLLGKMGFGLGRQSNALMGGLTTGAGAYVGSTLGPAGAAVGALAPAIIGGIGSRLSERSTAKGIDAISRAIRGGGVSNVPQLSQQNRAVIEALMQATGRGAAPATR